MSGNTSNFTNSPALLQAGSYAAQAFRNLAASWAGPGLVNVGDFAVTAKGTPNMSVDIGAGQALVKPTAVTYQGTYYVQNDSTYNTLSNGSYIWTAADATNPRIDLVCIEVKDNAHDASGANAFRIRIVDGTPNAGATHQLETAFWPAVPSGVVPIAAIRVSAAATTITTANITNLNPIGGYRGASQSIPTVETTTSATYTRLATPDFVFGYVPANAIALVSFEALWKVSVASGAQNAAMFINSNQLKLRPVVNGAPTAQTAGGATLGTFLSSMATAAGGLNGANVGVTADVSEVATGMSVSSSPTNIIGLPAGWYVFEIRYNTSANTLTVQNRRMWLSVLG